MSETTLQSLTEIFDNTFFRIPDFQRGYSWKKKNQLEDFWDDLANLKEDRIHYTGLLTVEPISITEVERQERWEGDLWMISEKELNAFYLIDGQQRLTTSIIFINEILSSLEDEEEINGEMKSFWVDKFLFRTHSSGYKSYIFGYERDNPSDEYFKTKVLEQESVAADRTPEHTLYTANLIAAKKFFTEKIRELEQQEVEELFKKVTKQFKFNLYEVDEELDVYVTFETMNNRGKPLSNLELLKNRLIYLSTLLEIDDFTRKRIRKDINETWKTIYEFLGKNKDNPMDDDVFLRNHWIMYFKYDRSESNSYAKFLLNDTFTAKKCNKKEIDFETIRKYIESLSEAVKSWFYLFNPQLSPYKDETKEWLQKLNRLGMGAFPPLLMAAMIKTTEKDFLPLLKSAERFVFLVFRITKRSSNTKNSHFYRLANTFYFDKDDCTIWKVIGNVNWETDGKSSDGNYYGWFDLQKFKHEIHEKNERREGFYSWSGLRYFLFEYEISLQKKAKGNIKWSDFNSRKKEDTIEHIYPQTPKDNCWLLPFKPFTDGQRKILLHSLGNLVLLKQAKNSELQNKCFSFKTKHTDKNGEEVGFFNGSYSEIAISTHTTWTGWDIHERGMKMLSFLEERWGVSFDDWKLDKAEVMQIDFLKKASNITTP